MGIHEDKTERKVVDVATCIECDLCDQEFARVSGVYGQQDVDEMLRQDPGAIRLAILGGVFLCSGCVKAIDVARGLK